MLGVYEEGQAAEGRSGRNLLHDLDHAQHCNAEPHGFDLYVIRRIEPGEEITFDYRW